jgi:hypothetical protein
MNLMVTFLSMVTGADVPINMAGSRRKSIAIADRLAGVDRAGTDMGQSEYEHG